jgi:4a-hydroxytetrahydrobiopterin dehydratase
MKLSPSDVTAKLAALQGWRFEGDALKRQFVFASFADAIAFITRLAFEAESTDHHPDLFVNFRRVTVTWTTHTEDGVTDKDFAGAARTDAIARIFPAAS